MQRPPPWRRKRVNEILKNSQLIFGQINYEKRRVFALIGKTNNSKYTVEIHRLEEKNNSLFEFYNIILYKNLIIFLIEELPLNTII